MPNNFFIFFLFASYDVLAVEVATFYTHNSSYLTISFI